MNAKRLLWPVVTVFLGLGCSSVVPPVGMAYSPVAPGANTPTIDGGTTPPSAPPPAISSLDAFVTRAVRRTLKADQTLAPSAKHVSVSCRKGAVTLKGTVPGPEDRDLIVERIAKLPGVDQVNDHLVIGG